MQELMRSVARGALCTGWLASAALAQPQDGESQEEAAQTDVAIEEIVTLGTRGRARSATDTPVAVDVIPQEIFERTGFVETARMLQQVAPSFNFGTNTISDGSDIARPATLRGLGPDQVLVLVNGKRHVGQAWLNRGDSFGRGSTGVDLNSIPTLAIESIEILRGAASSQYGSDAIAGVINVNLKARPEGTEIRAVWGQHYEGDGSTYTIGLNQGFALGDGGYLNLTAERRDRNPTNRADVSNRSFVFPGAEPTAGKRIFRIGDSEAENWTFLANAAVPLGEGFELYASGKYNDRDGQSTGFYRHPHLADRSVPQVFPSGFLPLQNTSVEDLFAFGGVRWEGDNDWVVDASVNFGENEFGFGAENTVNASIAAEFVADRIALTGERPSDAEIQANSGPTAGFSGGMNLQQVVINLDASGPIDIGRADPLYISAGFEHREEDYRVIAGDKASFSCGSVPGPASFPSVVDPAITANCGFQGFPGISTRSAGKTDRNNEAIYLEFEHDVTDAWLLTGAVRWEDFSGIGDKVTGKVATRLRLDETIALRGSFSTGFRAASLPQEGFTQIATQAGPGGLAQSLIANLADPFTQALGIEALDFETSDNFDFGFVWEPVPSLTMTVDFYRIKIDDRIVLSEDLGVDLLRANGLDAAADILAAREIDQGAVFFNAVDTETDGIDIVLTHTAPLWDGTLSTTLSGTYNETTIEKKRAPGSIDPDVFFGSEAESLVEDVQPNGRATLTFDYTRDRIGLLLRTKYFGETSNRFFTAETIFGCPPEEACGPVAPFGLSTDSVKEVDDAFIFDFELSLRVTDQLTLAAGANNIFDKMPNELPDNAVIRWISDGGGFGGPPNDSFGNIRFPLRGVPYGINGGFYYFRAHVSF